MVFEEWQHTMHDHHHQQTEQQQLQRNEMIGRSLEKYNVRAKNHFAANNHTAFPLRRSLWLTLNASTSSGKRVGLGVRVRVCVCVQWKHR
jgi:hypothetical protein